MIRFRCPGCNKVVKVTDADAASGVSSCDCGLVVRLPDSVRPIASSADASVPTTTLAVQPASRIHTPLVDDREVLDAEEIFDTGRLPRPGVDEDDFDNYVDFKRYRERPRRSRTRRVRRDLPTPSLIMEYITPFSVSLTIIALLSSLMGIFGLIFEGPELGLAFLGLLVFFLGGLWFTMQAIQDGELFFSLFVPGYSFYYAARNWDTAGKAMLFQGVGLGILIMACILTAVPARRVLALPMPPPPPPPVVAPPGNGGFVPPIPAPVNPVDEVLDPRDED